MLIKNSLLRKSKILLAVCFSILMAVALAFLFGCAKANASETKIENAMSFHITGTRNANFVEDVDFTVYSSLPQAGGSPQCAYIDVSEEHLQAFEDGDIEILFSLNGTSNFVNQDDIFSDADTYADFYLSTSGQSKNIYYKIVENGSIVAGPTMITFEITDPQAEAWFSDLQVITGTKLGDIFVQGEIYYDGDTIQSDMVTWTWGLPNTILTTSGDYTINYSVSGGQISDGSTQIHIDVLNDASCLSGVEIELTGYDNEIKYAITSISSITKDFDGNMHGFNLVFDFSEDYSYMGEFKLATDDTYGSINIEEAGTYTIFVKLEVNMLQGENAGSFYSFYKSFTYTINAIDVSAVGVGTWDGMTFTEQTPTFECEAGQTLSGSNIMAQVFVKSNGTMIDGIWEFEDEGTAVLSSGTYYATFTPNNNSFPTLTHVAVSVTVNGGSGVSIIPNNEVEYDGQAHGLSNYELPSGATIRFYILPDNSMPPDDPSTLTYNITNPSSISFTNAGSHIIYYKLTSGGDITYGETFIDIRKKELNAVVSSAMIQNGAAIPTITVAYSGFVGSDTKSVFTSEQIMVSYDPSSPQVGAYMIDVMIEAENYEILNPQRGVLLVYEGTRHTVSGTVLNMSGVGVSGATVTLEYNHAVLMEVASGSNGAYTFNNVPNESYVIRATLNGASTYYSLNVSQQGVARIDEDGEIRLSNNVYIDYDLDFGDFSIGISNVDSFAVDSQVNAGDVVTVSAREPYIEDEQIKQTVSSNYVVEKFVTLSVLAGASGNQTNLASWSNPVVLLIELTESMANSDGLKVYLNNGSQVLEVPATVNYQEQLFYGVQSGFLVLGTIYPGTIGIAYKGETEHIIDEVSLSILDDVENGTVVSTLTILVSGNYDMYGDDIYGFQTSAGNIIYGYFEFANPTEVCNEARNYEVRFVLAGPSAGLDLTEYDISALPTSVYIYVPDSGTPDDPPPGPDDPDEFIVTISHANAIYDGQAHTVSNYTSDDYFIAFSSDADIADGMGRQPEEWTYSLPDAPSYTNVGVYTVYFMATRVVDSAEYYGTTEIVITTKSLTVTANDVEITEGDELPAFSVQYSESDFVNGEDSTVLSGELQFANTYNSSERIVGEYQDFTITPSGLTSINYNITYRPGTLRVYALDLTKVSVSGKVFYNTTSSSSFVSGATVVLKQNDTQKQTTTNASGEFTIDKVSAGTYTLVVTKGDSSNFTVVEVGQENVTGINIAISSENIKIEVSDEVLSKVMIGNLSSIIFDDEGQIDSKVISGANQDILLGGGKAEINVDVVDATSTNEESAVILNYIKGLDESNKATQFFQINIGLKMTTASLDSTDIQVTETTGLLSFCIKLSEDVVGKQNICVYRLHNDGIKDVVQTLTTTANRDGEKIELSIDGKYITIYSKNFSLYAIGFYEESSSVNETMLPTMKIIVWATFGGLLAGMLITTLIVSAVARKNRAYNGGQSGKTKKIDQKSFTNQDKSAIPNIGGANQNAMPPYGQPQMGGYMPPNNGFQNQVFNQGAMTPNQMANNMVGQNPNVPPMYGPQMPNGGQFGQQMPNGQITPQNGGTPNNNNGNNNGQWHILKF